LSSVLSSSLNLGIVAHVDAGKTSLTERLLFNAGATTALGSVDAGTTRTDSMDVERRRGITVRSAVTSFRLDDLVVNLLDTPGHPDFIAEVERSLGVLDAAVMVVSSVEGVQPQTVAIWRALQRIGVPAVVFVNKMDRAGADMLRVVEQVRRRLTPSIVQLARARGEGGRQVDVTPVPLTDESVVASVAEGDDGLLARWVFRQHVQRSDVVRAIRLGVSRAALTPVVCGSAITGAGVPVLTRLLTELLPRADQGGGPVAGTVFAVDRDDGGRRAWIRLWAGELRVRDHVAFAGGRSGRLTQVAVSAPGRLEMSAFARAGQIAVVRGPEPRIGDHLGHPPRRRTHSFAPATLQALVEPEHPTQRTALYAGLSELADEDPLIDLRVDETDGEAAVSLHGEVQKEVIEALLEDRYGVRARFLETSVVCLERVAGAGSSVDRIKSGGNPYLAGIGLRVEAAPAGHGVAFSPGVERGNLPAAFIAATEEGVRSALRQGLHGWQVTDCLVTMTESGYWPRQSRPHQKFDKAVSSVAADFRNLAPVVVMAAVARAGTRVCEPIERFELEVPDDACNAVLALMGRMGAATHDTVPGAGYTRFVGHLASAAVPELASRLPDVSSGEGVLTRWLDHYAPVAGVPPPSRRRSGWDPLDRRLWFRQVPR
jgi:ribosomal protection tetracycline resistance protein